MGNTGWNHRCLREDQAEGRGAEMANHPTSGPTGGLTLGSAVRRALKLIPARGQTWRVATSTLGIRWPALKAHLATRWAKGKREERTQTTPETPLGGRQAASPSHSPKLNISASFSFQKAKLRSM